MYMTWMQAGQLARDILFNNSNRLYRLNLTPQHLQQNSDPRKQAERDNLEILQEFLQDKIKPQYLRVYWNDFTATSRMRAIPMRKVFTMLDESDAFSIGITKAALGLLQNDTIIPGVSATGEYRLYPDFTSLREGPRAGHISAWGEFREHDGSISPLCPRTLLRRTLDDAARHGLTFDIGFEIELLFTYREVENNKVKYLTLDNDGHSWSAARNMESEVVEKVIERVIAALDNVGIYIEQYHPESAEGQYEIILPKAPPMEAIEMLLYVRDVISNLANAGGWRVTLHPKPFPMACGTAAHVHMSISSPGGSKPETYEPFYAGVLKHLRAINAFTYSNPASYERVQDGCWAGGRWVAWGTQNRETPLRKIEDSHWEVKCVDGLANPYFAIAAILAAGTKGVVAKEKLTWRDCEMDPATLTENDRKEVGVEKMMPESLNEALNALRSDEELIELLGGEFVERYVAVKEGEMELLKPMSDEERRQWIMARY
jgi:glutamine synthetase